MLRDHAAATIWCSSKTLFGESVVSVVGHRGSLLPRVSNFAKYATGEDFFAAADVVGSDPASKAGLRNKCPCVTFDCGRMPPPHNVTSRRADGLVRAGTRSTRATVFALTPAPFLALLRIERVTDADFLHFPFSRLADDNSFVDLALDQPRSRSQQTCRGVER